MKKNVSQEIITSHLKNYGFIYQNSEIYGGLSNAWDMGPLGSIVKHNLKNLWINYFITSETNMFLLDTNIILNPLVWKASGHTENFSDPLIDCKKCRNRYRADKLIEEFTDEKINEQTDAKILENIIDKHNIKCPSCKNKDWTNIRKFNLMFDTYIGVVEDSKDKVYLRPETAQGIFINFKNIVRTQRCKIPFGVGQIGKSFRNEITPGNFIFRTREFEQMEIEFFTTPERSEQDFKFFENKILDFLKNVLSLSSDNLKVYDYPKNELAHYSKKTIDVFYNFPHGFSELWGLADRGDYDLTQHQNLSQKSLDYLDDINNKKFIPCVIEPSVGVERLMYAIFCDSYYEEKVNDETRVVMKLNSNIAPYNFAVLPLTNKLNDLAKTLQNELLKKGYRVNLDSSGSIGKRYRRQDAIGTPYCLTVDFDTQNDNSITIRHRDTMKQVRVKPSEITSIDLDHLFK